MKLTPNQMVMLADCLDIGFEGCQPNDENNEADLATLQTLEEVLRSMARRGVNADLVISDMGPALVLGDPIFPNIPGAAEALYQAGAS